MSDKTFSIMTRRKVTYNNDPQRRCYNGCHYSTATEWSAWEILQIDVPESRVEERLKFWRELNDYAISQRGKGAYKEFKAEESS